jgi:hypothetical protein
MSAEEPGLTAAASHDDQLRALALIDAALAQECIRFWLRGGWAIDFLLGRVGCPHADVDLVLWSRHRRRAVSALFSAGFRLDRELAQQVDLIRDGVAVSLIFVRRDASGAIVTDGISNWRWAPDALSNRRYQLAGIAARVVAPEQLILEKESYERETGRPPRPHDLESLATLRRLIASRRASGGTV